MMPVRFPVLIAVAVSLFSAGCVDFLGTHPVAGLIQAPGPTVNGAPAPASVTVPMQIDNNRLFIEATFHRPDGGVRKALVWVNMGGGGMGIAPGLRDEIGGAGAAVDFDIGGMPVRIQDKAIIRTPADTFASTTGPMPVEAILPAGVLQNFRVTLDYQSRTLTLAQPSDAPAPGVATPIEVNQATGLVDVQVQVDGQTWPVVLDCGGGYSWFEGDVVRGWLRDHPDWYRADGAVGQSNQDMIGFAFEQGGTVVRVPTVLIGDLQLTQVGILGSSPANGSPVDRALDGIFWRGWGKGAARPVIGWLGGSAFRDYRLTLDYKNHVAYWLKTSEPDPTDLNSVGISLIHTPTAYVIGGLPGCTARLQSAASWSATSCWRSTARTWRPWPMARSSRPCTARRAITAGSPSSARAGRCGSMPW